MILTPKSDALGAFFSTLCIVHCTVTPFIFVAQTCTASCCEHAPGWWQTLDYAFVVISFFAVLTSVKNDTKSWLRKAFWGSWFVFVLILINNNVNIITIPTVVKHIPSGLLIVLHLYNRKYCNCEGDMCVQNEK